jgi:hypothetical protein
MNGETQKSSMAIESHLQREAGQSRRPGGVHEKMQEHFSFRLRVWECMMLLSVAAVVVGRCDYR